MILKYLSFLKSKQEADDRTIRSLVSKTILSYGHKANLNFIDTTKVTDLSNIFNNLRFNGDVSSWNTENVITMNKLFYRTEFIGDITNWNVKNVIDMSDMFYMSVFNGYIYIIGMLKM